jgi:membrane fusion protein, heavy metal efflux system
VEQSGQSTYWLKAGRAGTVVTLNVTPGQRVAPEDGTPPVVVADLAEVIVEADVPPRDAGEIRVGQSATIVVAEGTGSQVLGQVETVSEVVDPARQVVPVRVSAQNQERQLRPNSFVHVVFPSSDPKPILVVPSAAVVSDGASSVVFVEVEPGVFKRRPVELGRRTRELAEITTGLQPAERVVTSGALLLLNAIDVGD